MAQDNRNKATQGQNQRTPQDNPPDESIRRGRSQDDRDSAPVRGRSAGKRDPEDVEDLADSDDLDEMDDRDDDLRAEGGTNRRNNIS